MTLRLHPEISIPDHLGPGGFDHGDVRVASGRVFVVHTANGSVEALDGPGLLHIATINGCAEASGVLCAPDCETVVAAARRAGHLFLIDPDTLAVRGTVSVGGRPNGPPVRRLVGRLSGAAAPAPRSLADRLGT